MPQSPDVQTVVNDPKFLQLPAQEQKKVLLKVDSNFKSLPEVEQNLVIQRLHFPRPTKSLPGGDPEKPLANVLDRSAAGVGRAVKGLTVDLPKATYHAAADPVTEDEKKRYGEDTRRSPGLVVSRMVADPMREEKRKRDVEMSQGHTIEAAGYEVAGDIPLIGPFAANLGERAGSGDIAGAASEGITSFLLPKAVSPTLKILGKPVLAKYAPTSVNIEGVEIPVLENEANPGSATGNKVEAVKSSGIGREKFLEVQKQQSAAVKEVIRRVAQQTSQMTGPMPESVSGSMSEAGDALHAKARPMYQALDAQLLKVPNMYLNSLDGVMNKAIAKVKELGGQIPEPSQLKSGSTQYPRQPLSDYMDVRSRLLKIGRETRDDAVRSTVWDNVNQMDAEIEKSLTSTKVPGLVDNWREANSLWRRGYALQRVSEALGRAEKGTPVEFQSPQVARVDQGMSPKTLVSQLNKMDAKGDLSRAFGNTAQGQQHIKAIREVADLLDRSQRTRIGKARDIEGIHVIERIKRIGKQKLAKAMTDPQGANAVLNYLSAKTATEEFKWASRIAAITAQGQVQPPPGVKPDYSRWLPQ